MKQVRISLYTQDYNQYHTSFFSSSQLFLKPCFYSNRWDWKFKAIFVTFLFVSRLFQSPGVWHSGEEGWCLFRFTTLLLFSAETRTMKSLTAHIYWGIVPSAAAAAAKSLQSCPTLCNAIDGSLPGSPVPEILQARTLEWVAISFSNVWKWKVKVKSLSRVRLLTTPWTAAYQAPPSMGFARQEYWNGLPLPSLRLF